MPRELVDLELRVVRDSDNDGAILVQLDAGSSKVWLPRSAIIEIEYKRGSTTIATVTLPESLAEEKGLT